MNHDQEKVNASLRIYKRFTRRLRKNFEDMTEYLDFNNYICYLLYRKKTKRLFMQSLDEIEGAYFYNFAINKIAVPSNFNIDFNEIEYLVILKFNINHDLFIQLIPISIYGPRISGIFV